MEKVDDAMAPQADKDEIKYRGIKAMPFVIGNEAFEKLGSIGTSSNLIVYLTTVFGMKSITATNVVNIFNGSCNFATLIGAFLSDTYLGRYKTLGFACLTSLMGMIMLTLTAAIPTLHPHNPCTTHSTSSFCSGPTAGQLVFLLFALSLMIIGAGGIRPCNLAFGAEQFNPNTESGKRGIASFFNWYYFTFTFAMMISMTLIVYVQSNINWALGLAIPAFLMFLACALFFLGTKLYVRIKPEGSPLVAVLQVPVAAFKKRRLRFPPPRCDDDDDDSSSVKKADDGLHLLDHVPDKSVNSKLPLTDQFRFLTKASIITEDDKINPDGSSANPWRLCTVQQVEQAKCIARILPIWVSGVVYYIVQVILSNYVVFQALQSNRHLFGSFQIPAASYNFFTMLGVTIWIPIYDRALVPLLRTLTGKEAGITVLQKIGVGMVLNVVAMLVSAYVEHQRRELALEKGDDGISPLSAMWLVPQLVLTGISEAFTMVGLVEFYYKQVPESMRSIGGSIFFAGMGLSSYLGSFLLSAVQKVTARRNAKGWVSQDLNQGRLDYFYYLIAGIELANVVYFLLCANWYRYRGNHDEVGKTTTDTTDDDVEKKKTPDRNLDV